MTKVWSRPSASSSSSFSGSGVSRKNGVSGAKNSRGCGSKITAPARQALLLGDADRLAEHLLMAAMDAVEIADGERRALELGRHVPPEADNVHR